MIKNIVFDFGQVLVKFVPAYIVAQHTSDAQTARLLEDVVFDRAYWNRLDGGEVSDDEAVAAFRTRLPSCVADLGEQVFRSWIDHIPPIEETWALVRDLHAHGVPLYLLSNISAHFAERADEFPILSYFNKCIFSGLCHMTKPDRAIYRHLLSECDIRAEETLFIDDSRDNIEGARAEGIEGYLFTGDAAALRRYLADVLKIPALLDKKENL